MVTAIFTAVFRFLTGIITEFLKKVKVVYGTAPSWPTTEKNKKNK
jgi:hypothetical protein